MEGTQHGQALWWTDRPLRVHIGFRVGALRSRVADLLPAHHIPVPSICRIGKHPLYGVILKHFEELFVGWVLEEIRCISVFHGRENLILLILGEVDKIRAECCLGLSIDGSQAGVIACGRLQEGLITIALDLRFLYPDDLTQLIRFLVRRLVAFVGLGMR